MVHEMSRGFLFVLAGTRDEKTLKCSIRIIQGMCDYNITVCADYDLSIEGVQVIKYGRIASGVRAGNRDSSLLRLVCLLSSKHDTVCYLDNDIMLVHSGFLSGFALAEKYGLCMPMNPRAFVTTSERDMGDIDIGGDVSKEDKSIAYEQIPYATSLIMGVMFFNTRSKDASKFLRECKDNQIKNSSRGQANLMRVMANNCYYPYALPEQYCACRKMKRPLAIHIGSRKEPECREWYEREFECIK